MDQLFPRSVPNCIVAVLGADTSFVCVCERTVCERVHVRVGGWNTIATLQMLRAPSESTRGWPSESTGESTRGALPARSTCMTKLPAALCSLETTATTQSFEAGRLHALRLC